MEQQLTVTHLPAAPKAMDFEAVYDAEWGYVWVWLKRLGVRDEDLADLTQEVFVRVFRAWDGCDFSRPLRPWLFGIAYRVMLGFRRLARHRLEIARDEETEEPTSSGEEAIARNEDRRLFLAALDAMDVRRRAVFVLHEVEGYTAPEIAEALGEPMNTVYSRLRSGRREFQEKVRRQHRAGVPRA